MTDYHFTPHKVIVAQALQLSQSCYPAFMIEQPERFLPMLDTNSMVQNNAWGEDPCPDCFLTAQFGTSSPKDLTAHFFRNEDILQVQHFVNVINYLTDFKAVAFYDEGQNGGFAVVVNHPFALEGQESGGTSEFERKALESVSETMTIRVASK